MRTHLDLPTLGDPSVVLMSQTRQENTFLCQPQQRNTAGRVFGGFIMRRAFELAFATSYVCGGSRPMCVLRCSGKNRCRTHEPLRRVSAGRSDVLHTQVRRRGNDRFLGVDEVSFQRPVDVGDLLRLKSCVLATEVRSVGSALKRGVDRQREETEHSARGRGSQLLDSDAAEALQREYNLAVLPAGLLHVEVNAFVTQPERRSSALSNTFNFRFAVEAPAAGLPPLKRVLPQTETEARRVWEVLRGI